MDLTFTKGQYGGITGRGLNGATIFTISQSMSRGDESVILRTSLPGLRDTTIKAPDGSTKWGRETNTKAMQIAAQGLGRWAEQVLGVTLNVNIVDNT